MSRVVNIQTLSDFDLTRISKELQVEQKASKYAFNIKPNYLYLFDQEGENVYLPFSYSNDYPRPTRNKFSTRNIVFKGGLREEQKQVKTEAIERLNSVGSVIIAAACGFGKTAMAIYIASKIKLKTLILCHRIVLIKQWEVSINKFCPTAKVKIVQKEEHLENDADFYIMNASNVSKIRREAYRDIGLLCVDEAHIIMAEKLSQCMRFIVPRYVIGLSATPYRTDGLDVLIEMYFGKFKIERKLFRKHTVYRLNTGFKPEVKMNKMGKVDWGSVLESQCLNKQRNELIINLVKRFKERTFLLLCKRVDQAKYLYSRLLEEKEDVTDLIGSKQDFEQSSRILVGTVQKTGVGFDHPRLDSLVLASDVEQYFIQYLGRVFRCKETEPIIFDIVDDYSLLLKHYRTRQAVYVEHGGLVKDFYKEFSDFPKINELLC